MTAIVAVHTVDGFAMGADGRRFDSKTNALETDEAQKVFLFDSETTRLAYAWAGVTQTSNKDGLLYDLLAASQEILPVAAKSGRDNFEFPEDCCAILRAFCHPGSGSSPPRA